MKRIKRMAAALALATLVTGAAKAETQRGYNAIEAAVTQDGKARARVLTHLDFAFDQYTLGYHALNEAEDDTYFGRHTFVAGPNGETKPAIVLKVSEDGLFDTKVGIRNTGLPKRLGLYGNVDATLDDKAGNLSAFLGKPFGKYSIEGLQEMEIPYNGKPRWFTEVQLNRSIHKDAAVFLRVESPNFSRKEAKMLAGTSYSF